MSLAARVVDDTDAKGIPDGSEPPTPSAWKLDAMAIGALVAGAIVALFLRRMA